MSVTRTILPAVRAPADRPDPARPGAPGPCHADPGGGTGVPGSLVLRCLDPHPHHRSRIYRESDNER
ncbi:hypothetical protein GCM10009551_011460 [Nocardiopsis tropica]